MNGELLRIIDSIHRDKDISLDILFGALEDAMASALRKRLNAQEEVQVRINRESGEITVEGTDEPIDPANLGRIAAQTAKQVIIQKIREAERDVILRDYETRIHEIVNGTVQRVESGHVIVNLGKTEGILPRREQVREERYRVGERIRCYVLDAKKVGSNVRIILSRSHPDLIRKLFQLEVPEIMERIIEIRALAREPGYRTKIAVTSVDSKVDAVGACVGVRGTRIKNIVAELGGERIDIVRWSDQSDILIANALNPAEVEAISLNSRARLARVIVAEDQLSRAIGALGQNVRLASKLTEWDIDVMSQKELDGEPERMKEVLGGIAGVGPKTIEKLFGSGFSLKKLATTTMEPLLTVSGIAEGVAEKLMEAAGVYIAEQRSIARQRRAEAEAAAPAELAAEGASEAAAGAAAAEEAAEADEVGADEEPADEEPDADVEAGPEAEGESAKEDTEAAEPEDEVEPDEEPVAEKPEEEPAEEDTEAAEPEDEVEPDEEPVAEEPEEEPAEKEPAEPDADEEPT